MTAKEYQKHVKRTDALLPDNYHSMGAIHMLMGMTTEIGELMDPYKKNLAYEKPIDWVNVKEEIGDLMWYVANFCNLNGFDLEEIMETNVKKLQERYPEKFDKALAVQRNLYKERIILEND
jgi:NTP pyrophosphatase (non-canonical NTP hydrolase)